MIYTITLNPALDRTLTIPFFQAGKVNRAVSVREDPGGKGINVSKTVAALGGKSVAMGILGGNTGRIILKRIQEMGIACDFEFADAETRTNIKISDPETGTTTDINEKGTVDASAAEKVLLRALSVCIPGDIFVIAGKFDTAKADIGRWIRLLNEKGALVMLDTEGEALKAGAKAHPALIKPNEEELCQLAQMTLTGEDEIAQCAMETAKRFGIRTVVVSLGGKGALFAHEDAVYKGEAIPVDTVCSVGAGDTMLAALAYGFDRGIPEQQSFAFALAAGAAAVTCPGTQSPTLQQINALADKATIWRKL